LDKHIVTFNGSGDDLPLQGSSLISLADEAMRTRRSKPERFLAKDPSQRKVNIHLFNVLETSIHCDINYRCWSFLVDVAWSEPIF
jgi:hypothetical protein